MGNIKGPDGLCAYCSDIATQWDHVPPKKWRPRLVLAGVTDYPFKRVPACADCNRILSGHPVFTVPERRAFVRANLWRRHERLLLAPGWQRVDLDTLGPGLRQYVDAMQVRRRHIQQRIGMCR